MNAHADQMNLAQDIPIPSIEGGDEETRVLESRSSSSDSSTSERVLTPPSTIAASNYDPDALAWSPNRTVDAELSVGIRGMNLSSPAPDRSFSSASLTPGPRHSRQGSRSGSHVNAIPPHDVRDEERVQNGFNLLEVEEAIADVKTLIGRMANMMGQSGMSLDEAPALHKLQRETAELAACRDQVSRIVGFVGDSGVGKSSLLNSLLDIKDLARASGGGSACTCIATEYHYHSESTFAVQVHLISSSGLREQIKPLLAAYRRFHSHMDDMTDEERKHFEKRAQLAWDTFTAMFRGRLHEKEQLVQSSEDDVLEKLLEWATALRPTIPQRQEGLLLQDCSSMLAELSSDSASTDTPAAWPYIEKVEIFSNAYILRTGLILVDLPGLRDLNTARRLITESYILRCDEVFAVCKIDRTLDNESLRDVFALAKNAGLTNVGVVCTRSEEIEASQAIREPMWPQEQVEATRNMMAGVQSAVADLDEIKNRIDCFSSRDEDELLPEDRTEHYRLLMLQNQLVGERRTRTFQLQQHLIRTRNTYVSEGLRRQDQTSPGTNNNIPIFCISNSLYWSVRSKPADKALPSLHLSGIIEMRRHCISIVAASRLRAAKAFETKARRVLSQLDSWLQPGARHVLDERKETMMTVAAAIQETLENHLNNRRSPVNKVALDLKQSFREKILSRRQVQVWSLAAGQVSSTWSRWHHASYSAFCCNEGAHSTAAVPYRDWNAEALEPMVSDLKVPWEDLMGQFRQIQTATRNEVSSAAAHAIEQLDDLGAAENRAVVSRLEIALEAQTSLLSDSLELHLESLESKLNLLRISLMSSIPSSLVRHAMRQHYINATMEYGGGSHRRRADIIEGAFGNSQLFSGMVRDFQSAFWRDVEATQAEFSMSISRYLKAVEEDLDLVRNERVAGESERNPEFRGLLTEKVRDVWPLLEVVKAALNRH